MGSSRRGEGLQLRFRQPEMGVLDEKIGMNEEEQLNKGIGLIVQTLFGDRWTGNQLALNLRLRLQKLVLSDEEHAIRLVREALVLNESGAKISRERSGDDYNWLIVQRNIAAYGREHQSRTPVYATFGENQPDHKKLAEAEAERRLAEKYFYDLLSQASQRLKFEISREMCSNCMTLANITKWTRLLEEKGVRIPEPYKPDPNNRRETRRESREVIVESPCRRVAKVLRHSFDPDSPIPEDMERRGPNDVLRNQLIRNVQTMFQYVLNDREFTRDVKSILEEVAVIKWNTNTNAYEVRPKSGHKWVEVDCVVRNILNQNMRQYFREQFGGGGGHSGGLCK